MRSLAADGWRWWYVSLLLVVGLLGAWGSWGVLARVVLYAVTSTARLEVEQVSHPMAAPLRAQVVATQQARQATPGALEEASVHHREGDGLREVLPVATLRIVAAFSPAVALGRVRVGQAARLRLEGFPWAQYGSVPATVTNVADAARDGSIRVELALLPDMPTSVPLQHGLSGTVEVAVEQVSPVALLLRSVGKRFGITTSPDMPHGQ